MIVCPRCGKENQDHYKFCLGCGAELPRDAAQPKSFTAPTPPAGLPDGGAPAPGGFAPPMGTPTAPPPGPVEQPAPTFGGAAAGEAAAPPAPEPGPTDCPQCGAQVPPNFKFCGSCGFDMSSARASAPAAAVSAAVSEPPAAAPLAAGGGRLVLIRPDGTEGESFALQGTTTVGRETAGPFGADSYLSPQHAEFRFEGGQMVVRDLNSLNGVYVRIEREVPTALADGALFRIGQEILRYEAYGAPETSADGVAPMGSPNPGFVGRLRLVIGRQSHGNAHPIPSDGMRLGRERGDVIFPEDGYVSGLHCELKRGEDGTMYLTDVGSSNGTFVRVTGEASLEHGTLLLMGQQLFRAEAG